MKTRKIAALAASILLTLSISTAQAAEISDIPQDGFLTNGKAVTEENVLELLRQLETEWPVGMTQNSTRTPAKIRCPVRKAAFSCAATAPMAHTAVAATPA